MGAHPGHSQKQLEMPKLTSPTKDEAHQAYTLLTQFPVRFANPGGS